MVVVSTALVVETVTRPVVDVGVLVVSDVTVVPFEVVVSAGVVECPSDVVAASVVVVHTVVSWLVVSTTGPVVVVSTTLVVETVTGPVVDVGDLVVSDVTVVPFEVVISEGVVEGPSDVVLAVLVVVVLTVGVDVTTVVSWLVVSTTGPEVVVLTTLMVEPVTGPFVDVRVLVVSDVTVVLFEVVVSAGVVEGPSDVVVAALVVVVLTVGVNLRTVVSGLVVSTTGPVVVVSTTLGGRNCHWTGGGCSGFGRLRCYCCSL